VSFARFFDKSAISAASLLRKFDYAEFRRRLGQSVVGVAYDASAATGLEGQRTLELLVDLLARLYPSLAIGEATGCNDTYSALNARLSEVARTINPDISVDIGLDRVSALAVVGLTSVKGLGPAPSAASIVYVGSDGWNVRASHHRPVGSGLSANPFGAGAAACVGAAAIFRAIFAKEIDENCADQLVQLSAAGPDADVSLSLLGWDLASSMEVASPQLPGTIDIGETFLVGVGAIGNAAVWALARLPHLQGRLHLVDAENLELSNLQRYVLSNDASIGVPKVQLAASKLAFHGNEPSAALDVQTHRMRWEAYVSARRNYRFDNVMLALDSAEDRIAVQASLPRWVVNAWTQPENLGISRHPCFTRDACVACLYLPTQVKTSRDAIYAEALGVQRHDEIMEIRRLLHDGGPVGDDFLRVIAERLGVPFEPLAPYTSRPLEQFYTEALCGGMVLTLGGKVGSERTTEVPMAFQSALAGIALAAELVIHVSQLREGPMPCRSELNLLRPLGTRLNSPMTKHPSGRCICQDKAYQLAYRAKYSSDRLKESSAT
jgi:hypothetical protein